jgi:hypothetical protein
MTQMVCEAGAHLDIEIETGIEMVACSPPPGIP